MKFVTQNNKDEEVKEGREEGRKNWVGIGTERTLSREIKRWKELKEGHRETGS
jgi:hypothetical protein